MRALYQKLDSLRHKRSQFATSVPAMLAEFNGFDAAELGQGVMRYHDKALAAFKAGQPCDKEVLDYWAAGRASVLLQDLARAQDAIRKAGVCPQEVQHDR